MSIFLSPKALPDEFEALLSRSHPSIFTKDGRIVFHCDKYRKQYDNLEECYSRIHNLIVEVAEKNFPRPPDPDKCRIIQDRCVSVCSSCLSVQLTRGIIAEMKAEDCQH